MQIIEWNDSYILTLVYIYQNQMPVQTFTNVTVTKGFENETHQGNV